MYKKREKSLLYNITINSLFCFDNVAGKGPSNSTYRRDCKYCVLFSRFCTLAFCSFVIAQLNRVIYISCRRLNLLGRFSNWTRTSNHKIRVTKICLIVDGFVYFTLAFLRVNKKYYYFFILELKNLCIG